MPERSTPQEDVEELIAGSYASGESYMDERGEEIRRLADGTRVLLSEQGRQWHQGFVPDVALTIVRSWKEGKMFVYRVCDEKGHEFEVRDTDVEVDTSRSIDSRSAP